MDRDAIQPGTWVEWTEDFRAGGGGRVRCVGKIHSAHADGCHLDIAVPRRCASTRVGESYTWLAQCAARTVTDKRRIRRLEADLLLGYL